MRCIMVVMCLWALGCAQAAESVASTDNLVVPKLPKDVAQLPVLHRGRVKPYAVAAEEIVLALTGYSAFGEVIPAGEGLAKAKTFPAGDLLMTMMLNPEVWHTRPFLYVPYLPLQQQLGLRGQWASPADADASRPYLMMVESKQQRAEQTGERVNLDKTEREARTFADRVSEAMAALAGEAIALVPLAPTPAARARLLRDVAPTLVSETTTENEALWRSRLRQSARASDADAALARADIWLTFSDVLHPDAMLVNLHEARLDGVFSSAQRWIAALQSATALHPATATSDLATFSSAHAQLLLALREASADCPTYPSSTKLAVESAYVAARPFTWAWLAYVLGGIITAVALSRREAARLRDGLVRGHGALFHLGVLVTLIGILCNVFGLGCRVYITSLGAVTNLYETLVYVALIAASLGLWFARSTGNGFYAVAGGLAGGLCAMVGEAIPPDFGSHIGQLQPVLRSKFWLWTHVKTVVASYAAFILAWAMGNIALLRATRARRAVTGEEARTIYRCLQVGVVLIAAGTLLGAVWADQAWGRFWGWDPKEVGALLILLCYLIPLHLRYAGSVGPTGLAGWSVLGFLSVMWSWYGVNFIQGSGLHAYAFGAGGQTYVLSACALQIAITIVQLVMIHRRVHSSTIPSSFPSAPSGPTSQTPALAEPLPKTHPEPQ